jgi:hypothetical protein
VIESLGNDTAYEAILKMGKYSKKAQIRSGWARAMRKLKIKEDKVYMFVFDLMHHGRISLCLWRAYE